MNKLIEEVCRILDFPLERLDLALKEGFSSSSPKLYDTWMFVNGELTYISGYDLTSNSIMDEKGKLIVVETLEPWLPESGIYTDGKAHVHISKRTHKHWQKSYKDSNYITTFLGDSFEFDMTKLAKSKPQKLIALSGNIYYERWLVGYIEDKEVQCINPSLYQELIDYSSRRNLGWNVSL